MITGKYLDINLIENNDFQASYTNNIDFGTATIAITGINNFQGKIILTFIINQIDDKTVLDEAEKEILKIYSTDLSSFDKLLMKLFNGSKEVTLTWVPNSTSLVISDDGTINIVQSNIDQNIEITLILSKNDSQRYLVFNYFIPKKDLNIKSLLLNIENSAVTGGSYNDGAERITTIQNVVFGSVFTLKSTSFIQGKSGLMKLYNKTSLGKIYEIIITLKEAKDSFQLLAGKESPSNIITPTVDNNVYSYDTSKNDYAFFELKNGNNTIYIESIQIKYELLDCEPIEKKLAKPINLFVQDKVLFFDTVKNASSYELYSNGEKIMTSTTNQFSLIDLIINGTYRLTVKAVDDSKVFLSSDFSESIEYIVENDDQPIDPVQTIVDEVEFYSSGQFSCSNKELLFSYTNTYTGNKNQVTSGKTLTIKIENYVGKVSKIVLGIRTNTSKGKGIVSILVNQTVIASENPVGKDSTGLSTTAYDVKYEPIVPVTVEKGSTIEITISASENSIYLDYFQIHGTNSNLTDEDKVLFDLNSIEMPNRTTTNISLPKIGKYGSTLVWSVKEGNRNVLNELGEINRQEENVNVTLMVTASIKGTSHSKDFTITVLGTNSLNPDLNKYYDSISNTVGEALKKELRLLITNTHTKITSYDDCAKYAPTMDEDPNNSNNMLLFYTGESISKSRGGWNKEHVWPRSRGWFQYSGAGSDLHHIRPCDSDVNSSRSNHILGEKSGCYEPYDFYKGDTARIILYLFTRYHESDNFQFTSVAESIDILLKWNNLDPVSDAEILRNNFIYTIQGNRNPFIDNADYANQIWS